MIFLSYETAYVSEITREYIRTCIYSKFIQYQNFKVESGISILMKGVVNPHDEIKGSISTPKGKRSLRRAKELLPMWNL
jgi:hypothetical protein